MILRIYVIFPALSKSEPDDITHTLDLLNICRSALLVLSGGPRCQEIVFGHPVCSLWIACDPQPPKYSDGAPQDTTTGRSTAWRQVDGSWAKRRIVVIYRESLEGEYARTRE